MSSIRKPTFVHLFPDRLSQQNLYDNINKSKISNYDDDLWNSILQSGILGKSIDSIHDVQHEVVSLITIAKTHENQKSKSKSKSNKLLKLLTTKQLYKGLDLINNDLTKNIHETIKPILFKIALSVLSVHCDVCIINLVNNTFCDTYNSKATKRIFITSNDNKYNYCDLSHDKFLQIIDIRNYEKVIN
jgi:hypothetical protein